MQLAPGKRRRWSRNRRLGEFRREPERTALSGLALDADLALHLLHQSSADGEPQTCPAKAASGGAVGLREGLEQSRLHILGNADAGISDGEP